MKKLIILIATIIWLQPKQAYSQVFTIETGTLYLSDDPLVQFGSIKVLTGVLKKNDKIEIYSPAGRKFSATVTKIDSDDNKNAPSLKANQNGFVDLKFTEDPGKGSDYLRAGYKGYPAGFKVDIGGIKAENEAKIAKSINFKTNIDGKTFRAKVTYKGALLLRKGIKNYIDKPYMQLQFGCVDEPDSRTLTVQIMNPKEGPGKYGVADLEVNFSGSKTGKPEETEMFGFVNKKGDTDFTVEITNWSPKGKNAIISGKIYGNLKEVKLLGKPKLAYKFTEGVFENIEVEIINEQMDMKDMFKAAGAGGMLKN